MALTDVHIDDERIVRGKQGETTRKRIGVDGGVVTVEETKDGRTSTRRATDREVAAYEREKAAQVKKSSGSTKLQAVRDATTVAGVRDALVAYLEDKYPEDA